MKISPQSVWLQRLLIGLVWVYVGALVLAPLGALVWGAFAEGVGPLLAVFTQPPVLWALGRSLGIALVVVVVHGVCGTTLAWVLVRHKFPGQRWLNSLIDLPFAVSAVVVGYMLLLVFGRNGWLGPLLLANGVRVAFEWPGLLLATLFVTLPFMVRELIPVLEAFGVDQELAATTLGANGWQTFWWVTFPALRWGFFYGLTLTLARALGEFGAVLVIGGGIQGRTDTATVLVYHALEERQYVTAYGVALLLGLFSLLLVLGVDAARQRAEK